MYHKIVATDPSRAREVLVTKTSRKCAEARLASAPHRLTFWVETFVPSICHADGPRSKRRAAKHRGRK